MLITTTSRLALLALPAALALSGCGDQTSDDARAEDPASSTVEAVDLAEACPATLPTDADADAERTRATEAPELASPTEAWLCTYTVLAVDDQASDDQGGWRLEGEPEQVDDSRLPALDEALSALAPADPDRPCTMDIGPRYLVVYAGETGLTGVAVDDFGCRDVRLTDDPRTTPLGSGEGEAAAGVFDGGRAVLTALGIGRTD